jgi:hypothetical protein
LTQWEIFTVHQQFALVDLSANTGLPNPATPKLIGFLLDLLLPMAIFAATKIVSGQRTHAGLMMMTRLSELAVLSIGGRSISPFLDAALWSIVMGSQDSSGQNHISCVVAWHVHQSRAFPFSTLRFTERWGPRVPELPHSLDLNPVSERYDIRRDI